MLGRSLTAAFPPKHAAPADAPAVLTVRDLHAPRVEGVSLTVHAGEIVALAGLVGAGRTELARAIFGAERPTAGSVEMAGGDELSGGPRARLRAGVAMIPESRKEDGLLLGRSVTENVSLASLASVSRYGFVRRGAERRRTREALERWTVRADGPGAPASSLSGGNQQKLLFARMLLCGPQVLVADEPTRGVDVGAKRAIYDLLVSLADEGLGVLLISSELEEVLGLAHRVLVMRAGRIVGELRGEQMTESAVLAAAFEASAPGARRDGGDGMTDAGGAPGRRALGSARRRAPAGDRHRAALRGALRHALDRQLVVPDEGQPAEHPRSAGGDR